MRSLLIALGVLTGCGGFSGSDSPADGMRLVQGRLTPPGPELSSGRNHVAFELVAAALDARQEDPLLRFAPGTPFSPSSNAGQPVTFRIALPVDQTFVLFFQTPVEGSRGVGQLVAPLRFSDGHGAQTDILPGRTGDAVAPPTDLDVGIVEITLASDTVCGEGENCSRTYQVLLGEGRSANPLATTDADGDGTPDLDDTDDDGDLIPDESDDDANGDGIPDQFQTLDALADYDGDGVPDRFQARSQE